jgi:hypothetical protein
LDEVLLFPFNHKGRSSQRIFYSGQELDYAYFVHSLHLLGKLIFFERGRAFFPSKIKEQNGETNRNDGIHSILLL